LKKVELFYNKHIEEYTYKLLRAPQHKGGPVEEQRARKMAVTERKRHEAMMPLRKFVMENYRFVRVNFAPCIIYERKYTDND